ncbi:MAG TPA: alkaline phosphatase family protein [Candidatus Binatia bacterium]|jgi:phospholipase C
MSRASLVVLAVLLLLPVPIQAAEQAILGNKLLVKNPSTPDKKKILVSAKEKPSNDTLVGDPVTNGATLTVRLTGLAPDEETFNLPMGISPMTGKPFWSGDSIKGFKYKDKKGENGAVSTAQIALKNGTFKIKATISGKTGHTINTVPPNPGADGCVTLTINSGDSYSINYATGTAVNKGAQQYKILKPTSAGTCIRANPNNLPIDHIVVDMQENRSADSYFGQLSTQGQPAYEAEPNTGNPDPTNNLNPPILPYHKTNYCEVLDLDHSWKGTHNEVNNGAMDGFTTVNANATLDPNGHRTMGYYDQTDLPFYYGVMNTFATGDRYFCSVQAQTDPNRLYFLAGSSFGYLVTGQPQQLTRPSVFNLLDNAGVTWRIYTAEPTGVSYGSRFFKYVLDRAAVRVFPMSQYYADLTAGTLPNVAFIDPSGSGGTHVENDEHPSADIQIGQKFVADNINALMSSPAWATSAFFLTWDEHGGFYDHVPPPVAPVPDTILPRYAAGDPHALFDHYGVRVPVAVVSPYSNPSSVSHVVNDHTSILRFIETRFGLPSLTNRDVAANPMLEFFDFNTATFATPPSLPAAVIDQTQLNACP